MQYISTRGQAPALGFQDVFLAALARDGGLYVPESWPTLDMKTLDGRRFVEVAEAVCTPYLGGEIEPADFRAILESAYGRFRHPAVAPLVQIGEGLWVMELFHGPTLAFKDVAMQVLGGLFEHVLAKLGRSVTVIGATSGDTGGAAVEALRGRKGVNVFILYPDGRVSDVQRRQMTTVSEDNIHTLAVDGTFDDCQALVKAMFNDTAFREEASLSGINSINWARVMPQITYYATACLALGGDAARPINFSVPTGNFGDVFAGYAAANMGVPVGELIVATNQNDILTRTLNAGEHILGDVHPTVSPSMDIQVSSNFERLLFDLYDRDGAAVSGLMGQLKQQGGFALPPAQRAAAAQRFSAYRSDEAQTLDTIRRIHQDAGYLLDPHTAVGVHAAEQHRQSDQDSAAPIVVLGTAHPAKFPAAVQGASGVHPELPEHLADLHDRTERSTPVPADLKKIQDLIRAST